MLGLGKDKSEWRWAASGKHPLGKDYFRFDVSSPLQSAFASWVDQGFSSLPEDPDIRRAICFWRFWAKGAKKGELACGLLKASSDGIGRPYPLLIIGTGYRNGWEKHWEHLPRVLENLWQHMEYIAARRFKHLHELAEAVRQMRPPGDIRPEETDRHPLDPGKRSLADISASAGSMSYDAACLKAEQVVWVPLDDQSHMAPSVMPVIWGAHLKEHGLDAPRAFFIGGPPGKAFLVIFFRSLQPQDFVQFWSAGKISGFNNPNG